MKGQRLGRMMLAAVAIITLGGCATSGGGPGAAAPPPIDNVQPVEVSAGPTGNVADGLFTSVTVCLPGTSTCQTIDGVAIDTGSIGLRLLSSEVSLALPRAHDSAGNALGNCVVFGDMSYLWGTVATADVQMAGEKASSVPIQIVGAPDFPEAPAACSNGGTEQATVSDLGARGLLGIGLFRQDCGGACSGAQPPAIYFSCVGSTCGAVAVPVPDQLQNPVWLFPQDNNGTLISLPAVPSNGAPPVTGSLIFGIGTQANNALGTASVYTTDDIGNFSTTFAGQTYPSSYLDTGSNGIFFSSASALGFPDCSSNAQGFYCPPATVSYVATATGQNGASAPISFDVANADTLFASGNAVFDDLAGDGSGDFDWGLPFFLGRSVFTGIEGQTSPAGAGPYWAY